ncbi:MAG: DUF308 domain-containing protein [Bradyrhizobium sp.]|nr:DUF308 domain-containing protein [Bradyrhizobium sp.]
MIIVLQVVGALAALIGVVTIGVGVPVKEFSFGNTLIVAGTLGLCTGLILLGLSVVAIELRLVARRLAAGNGRTVSEPRARPALPAFPAPGPVSAAPGEGGPAFPPPPPIVPQTEPPGAPPVPWHEEPAGRARPPDAPAMPAEPEQAAAAPGPKPRRNLMFQSSVRKDRERQGAPADLRGQPPTAPPGAEMGEPRPANFEDAWPRPDRPRAAERTPENPADRAAEPPLQRRAGRTPASSPTGSNAPSAAAERTPPARAEDPPAGVTVLKSGVVDGMAYSLYSDGSIEAQMPEGMMRFASIDELRAHLDQRS